MSREEIREILARHFGSQGVVARRARVRMATVTVWLQGRSTSAHVARHCKIQALALLELERTIAELEQVA